MNYLTKMRVLLPILAAFTSVGCTTLPSFSQDQYVDAFDGANVTDNQTRYSQALTCIKPTIANSNYYDKRFSVGRVSDFTGKEDLTNGKRITQGASLMVMSALDRAGVSLVERFDTSIADIELKYADNKLITDDLETRDYRKILSGTLPGSDYHVVGGVTEVNYNIRSGSIDSSVRFLGLGARYFVMNVALDLRLVNTQTLEVVNVQSLQKQIVGTELSGGFFRVFSDGAADIALSERTQEPIQRGVRMVVEQAVFNMLNEFYQLNQQDCSNPGHNAIKRVNDHQAANDKPKQNTTVPTRHTPNSQPRKQETLVKKPNNAEQDDNAEVAIVKPQLNEEEAEKLLGLFNGDTSNANNNNRVSATSSSTNFEKSSMQKTSTNEQGSLGRTELTGLMDKKQTSSSDNNSSRRSEMKEKLFWGSKPIIR